MAHPIDWTPEKKEEAFNLVLSEIEEGSSLRKIIATRSRNEVPCYSTFMEWVNDSKELAKQYAHACEQRSEKIFDEIIEIADDSSRDVIQTENGEIQNSEFISRSRLRVDARKWVLSKMNPKKFGDKVDLTTGGEKLPASTLAITMPDGKAIDDFKID